MKLAVTDACIFIDLCDTELTAPFFGLGIEVHTSVDVFHELYAGQQQILRAFELVGKLTVHNISGEDRISIAQAAYPRALSESDKTVLYIAQRIDAMVLSSDGVVRRYAEERCIECHGVLWILDKLVEEAQLSAVQAMQAIEKLAAMNTMYRLSKRLADEVERRVRLWRGK